ncbi:MAG: cell wall hydrolase [Rhodospirillaceae bacterium]|nr:cell wall hydrolase [Rhodospirillaceae bacterium]
MKHTAADADTLARTVFGEARGEKREGQTAVAWVIRNRVEMDLGNDGKPDWWGEGIQGVCKKPGQFSCWLKSDRNARIIQAVTIDHPVFRQCLLVADDVLRNAVADPTIGATHYHHHAIKPAWIKGATVTRRIGAHIFSRA